MYMGGPVDCAATLLQMSPEHQSAVLSGLGPKKYLAMAAIQKHGAAVAGSAGSSEASAATTETLVKMGPAKQALILATLPAAAAAALLGPLTPAAKASALVGVTGEQRERILAALPPLALADTEAALRILEADNEPAPTVSVERGSSGSRSRLGGLLMGKASAGAKAKAPVPVEAAAAAEDSDEEVDA